MNTFTQAGTFLIQSLGSLYLSIVLLRFLLQWVKADFYNPISRFLVNATHLPSKPLRKLLPTFGSFDMASLVLALLVQWLTIQLTASINGAGLINIGTLLGGCWCGITGTQPVFIRSPSHHYCQLGCTAKPSPSAALA